jgi:acyl-coenzyme A synthetase/AMP-(fatty) acid ligase
VGKACKIHHFSVPSCSKIRFEDKECLREVDERTLIAFCKERMANYKFPKAIHFVADLSKTPSGKILRRELRKLAD